MITNETNAGGYPISIEVLRFVMQQILVKKGNNRNQMKLKNMLS